MPDLTPIVIDEPEISIIKPGSAGPLAGGSIDTIVSLENDTGNVIFVDAVRCEGNVDAEYFIFIDTERKEKLRTPESKPEFLYPTPLRLEVGQIMDVKVEHHHPATALFSATIIGHRDG